MNGRALLDALTGGAITRTEAQVQSAEQALARAQAMLVFTTVASGVTVLLVGYLLLTRQPA